LEMKGLIQIHGKAIVLSQEIALPTNDDE
jgi:hypothetical protein